MATKKYLGISVLEAARQRIAWTFDQFSRVYVSFSGGKDSTVMLHLVMAEAIKRQRKVGVLIVDLEGQYEVTINHIAACMERYKANIEPYWVAIPIHLRNAVSQYEPQWICWEPERKADWIRQPHPLSITDPKTFPFYQYAMEFEEFVPEFGHWYGRGEPCACFVGIRAQESLNRWRTVAGHGTKFEGRNYTNLVSQSLWNIYPIYDFATEDIWVYHGKCGGQYNQLYDYMWKAGLTIHQMRICQPYGDDQRKGLWLFHVVEPQTWARVVARVNGANQGALYAQETGNILGRIKIDKPPGHTWKSFARLLLDSMPKHTKERFENKISIFLHWWQKEGFVDEIPDEASSNLEASKDAPSWRRICKSLLRNDYWCKGLSFTQQKTGAYEKYQKLMEKRKAKWKLVF